MKKFILGILLLASSVALISVDIVIDGGITYNIETLIAGLLILNGLIILCLKKNVVLYCILMSLICLIINAEYIVTARIYYSLIISAILIIVVAVIQIIKVINKKNSTVK